MSLTNNNYTVLLEKLDAFIRKYYKNQLIKGAIYSTGTILLFYLSISLLEYYAHFDTIPRTFLFYTFILANVYILTRLVAIPLFKLNKLGRIISHEEAASIIGKHFKEVQDKLLNVLQLQNQNQNQNPEPGTQNSELIEASINQKINALKPIPFTSAIDFSQNKKYLKYAMIPVVLFALILFAAPSIITDSTKRLVNHSTYFEKEAPFQFVIQNKDLQAIQHEDYTLEVKLTGDEIPENIYIEADGNEYKLDKENTISFNYIFKNIQENIRFRLSGDDYTSKEYELTALPKPILLDFTLALDYPKYTGKKNEQIKNTGDIIVPAGTKVKWNFNTQNTTVLRMAFSDTSFALQSSAENEYSYSYSFLKSRNYTLTTANDFLKNKDSVRYSVNVIPDAFPSIEVEEKQDSLSSKRFYFRGGIKDDYGFARLSFNYCFINKKDSAGNSSSLPASSSQLITINTKSTQNHFFHYWDVSELNVSAGDQIEYYFEVWDNDGVSGSKSTRSQRMIFKAPSKKEIQDNAEKNNEKLKDDLEKSISQAKDLQKHISDLNRKMLEKKQLGWEEKKKLEDLLEKQKNLQNKVEEIKKDNTINNSRRSEFSPPNEQILEKQQQLEELFKDIMTDEMKELFKELEKLLDQLDKDKVQETLEKMKLSNKDIEKELDRTLEIFKQLEFQQKLTETIENLDELAKKQEQLSEKSKEKNADNKELDQQQQELNKEFEDIKKELDELEKKNSELEQPNEMQKTDQQEQDIKQDMQKSSEQLQQNKSKKASESQKDASKKMEQLSQQLSQMQSEMESEAQGEDINKLRDILENLVKLSFDQEALMKDLSITKIFNPQYVKINQQQKKLQDDSKMIEDSILALSKRVPQIESMVNREISSINMNMGKAIEAMAERQSPEAGNRQQLAMTSINNLALLLNEALEQMQAQMRQQGQPGGGSCNKPGGMGQKPSMGNMRKMQEQLNQQIQKLKEQMEKAKKEGQKPGQQGKGGQGGMSEELAKLAAQQEAIRREVQKMLEEMKKDGKNPGGNAQKLAEEMEQTETDLVNKMISQETMKRQQEILTKLLEHEKAEKEREMDEKRESNQAKNENFSNPNEFLEYKRLKEKEMELLKTVPPSLKPFYKNKVTEYFNNFE